MIGLAATWWKQEDTGSRTSDPSLAVSPTSPQTLVRPVVLEGPGAGSPPFGEGCGGAGGAVSCLVFLPLQPGGGVCTFGCSPVLRSWRCGRKKRENQIKCLTSRMNSVSSQAGLHLSCFLFSGLSLTINPFSSPFIHENVLIFVPVLSAGGVCPSFVISPGFLSLSGLSPGARGGPSL